MPTWTSLKPLGMSALLACLGLGSLDAQGKEHVFQLGNEAAVRRADFVGYERSALTFGLSDDQRDAIYRYTGGGVDMRHYFRVRVPNVLDGDARRTPGWLGEVEPVVSPFWGAPIATPGRAATDQATGPVLEDGAMDPALQGQWWITDLNAPAAWAVSTGRGVTIADCDSGFYVGEADLRANLVFDQRRDFSDPRNPLEVADGSFVFHGTAVAAIMTAVKDGVGTNGIAYDSRLIPLQNYNYDRRLDGADKEEATARCILHAIRIPDVDVVVVENQTTTGSSETFAGTRDAIKLALQSGIAVVAAAGNGSRELLTELRYDTGSVIVGAVRQGGRMSNFSNFGSRVTVSAFGEGVQTLYGPGGRMDTFGGTTAATAQVGATVALMRAANPSLTPAQIRRILLDTRRTTVDNQKVGGLVDVLAAVQAARGTEGDGESLRELRNFRAGLRVILGD